MTKDNDVIRTSLPAGDGCTLAGAVLFVLAFSALLGAQPATEPAVDPPPNQALADRQAQIRDRVARLEDRLFQLSQALKKSEPDKAARLVESLGASRSLLVRQKIEEIAAKLRGEQYAEAVDSQEALTADLRRMLQLLLEDDRQLEDRREEIEKLEAMRQALGKIIDQQRRQQNQAHAAATSREQAAALRQALKQTRQLEERQRDLAGKSSTERTDKQRLLDEQARLKEETGRLAEEVQGITEPGRREPLADGPAARIDGAAKQMGVATERLRQDQAEEAGGPQQEAAAKLAEAAELLEKQVRELDRQVPLPEQARNQRQTADETEKLAEDMKSSSRAESGRQEPEQGQPGGEERNDKSAESSGGESAPGLKDVQDAVPMQRQAAEQLEKGKPAEAEKKQAEALQKLQQARDQLSDSLEQLRKEQQEELLAALEARFRAMLARQIECTRSARRLNDLGRENWRRTDQFELVETANRQGAVAQEAEQSLFILTEEGTTVVFPRIVRQVRDDARDVAALLAAAHIGPDVVVMQEGIEQSLRELIDAVVERQKENKEQADPQQGGPGENASALLPGSAELKLLRACQMRVNEATTALENDRASGKADESTVRARLEKLAQRQEQVSDMAREMHEALVKPQ